MYYTGLDPMTGKPVYVPKGDKERRLQRALLQYFKPENYADVRTALETTEREDLIGSGPNCLISGESAEDIENGRIRILEEESRRKTPEKFGRRLSAASEVEETEEVRIDESGLLQITTIEYNK